MVDVKLIIDDAARRVKRISHSSLVIARQCGVEPKQFAKAWFETQKNDSYLAEIAKEFVSAELEYAQQVEKKTE